MPYNPNATDPYADMTHDDEHRILADIVREEGVNILGVGDVYSDLREHYNNAILDRWEQEDDGPSWTAHYAPGQDDCPLCGAEGSVSYGSWDTDDGAVMQTAGCQECGAEWVDCYVYSGSSTISQKED
ncbi:hypothetical protein [Oceanidesulfovibrio marinus]|uniref:Uncharacterized protein n=1 Tax=Oceanidesulfovibrio marinus TaxID=370038 RepID=A0A6P1ZCG1_9BACT|nr:hypothetical protein [Oceanidesulfovibrio marinus]TVM31181.1 hypothetical protein DQK91_18905 [Oceanidesulfovibrio marinus]